MYRDGALAKANRITNEYFWYFDARWTFAITFGNFAFDDYCYSCSHQIKKRERAREKQRKRDREKVSTINKKFRLETVDKDNI